MTLETFCSSNTDQMQQFYKQMKQKQLDAPTSMWEWIDRFNEFNQQRS